MVPPAVLRLYVPPRVLSGMLCRRPRLRRPRVPQSRPLQASTPEAVRRLFFTPKKFTFLGARLALPLRQTRNCSLLRQEQFKLPQDTKLLEMTETF